jgi:exopolyphosphatase/guanosine-5'-triphosphate,3'-diphosphate pyrophosphatase
MKTRRVALIEIGTNSIKFLVAEVGARGWRQLAFATHVTRIGLGLRKSGRISTDALEATARVVMQCRARASRHRAERVFAFATYALRKAGNARAAVRKIERAAGTRLRILTGREEATFAYRSARVQLDLHKPNTLLIDIGGGSTEIVLARRGRVERLRSLPLGALHLTEQFISGDPIAPGEIDRLSAHLNSRLGSTLRRMRADSIEPGRLDLVASGGSVGTAARMIAESAGRRWLGSLTLGDVNRTLDHCLTLTLAERRRVPGLDPKRADIIPAGLVLIRTVMRLTRKRVLFPNDGGVRAGVLEHLMENDLQWPS